MTPDFATADARLRDPRMALPVLVALALGATFALAPALNRSVFGWLNAWATGPAGGFWLYATVAGDTAVVLALLGALHWRRPLAVRAVPAALLLVALLVHVPKPLVGAPRPLAVLGGEVVHVLGPMLTMHSFPSGHAAAAFTGAGLVAFAGASRASALVALAAAVLVALSRCVVGAHWPVDIAAGAAAGWIGAWAAVAVTRRAGERLSRGLHGLGLAIVAVCWIGIVTFRITLLR